MVKKKVRQNRKVGFERFKSNKGKGKESQRLSLKKRQDGNQKERETAMEKQIKGTDTKREKEKQTEIEKVRKLGIQIDGNRHKERNKQTNRKRKERTRKNKIQTDRQKESVWKDRKTTIEKTFSLSLVHVGMRIYCLVTFLIFPGMTAIERKIGLLPSPCIKRIKFCKKNKTAMPASLFLTSKISFLQLQLLFYTT